jgi:hypothetical protein
MLLDGLDTDEIPVWMIRRVTPADLEAFLKRLRLAISNLALPPT